jgi:16S rRNA (cytidine1402-2'-O)-methyltransferase
MHPGKLILLPNLLEESLPHEQFLPASVSTAVHAIQGLITESEKTARRYLRRFLTHEEMTKIPLRLLNEHTKEAELKELLAPLQKGEWWGLLTDAGLPCLADPGAELVWLARTHNIAVEALPGPSSIVLALQLSGLLSQRFAFHGYLPRESPALETAISALEKRSQQESAVQVFIEAPYRSQKLLDLLLNTLHPTTRLCVAASLTTPTERVLSLPVAKFKQANLVLGKEPAVFLLKKE